jgi:hypothetical protein
VQANLWVDYEVRIKRLQVRSLRRSFLNFFLCFWSILLYFLILSALYLSCELLSLSPDPPVAQTGVSSVARRQQVNAIDCGSTAY